MSKRHVRADTFHGNTAEGRIADPDVIQRQVRASMELEQNEIDCINNRLITCMERGQVSIPMHRVVHDAFKGIWTIVSNINAFTAQYYKVQRCEPEVISDEIFSNAVSVNREEHQYCMGMLSYFRRKRLRWIIKKSRLILTPHESHKEGFIAVLAGALGLSKEAPKPAALPMALTSVYHHRAKIEKGDIVVAEYVISIDVGLSNLSKIDEEIKTANTPRPVGMRSLSSPEIPHGHRPQGQKQALYASEKSGSAHVSALMTLSEPLPSPRTRPVEKGTDMSTQEKPRDAPISLLNEWSLEADSDSSSDEESSSSSASGGGGGEKVASATPPVSPCASPRTHTLSPRSLTTHTRRSSVPVGESPRFIPLNLSRIGTPPPTSKQAALKSPLHGQ